jgi:hypothetical protein
MLLVLINVHALKHSLFLGALHLVYEDVQLWPEDDAWSQLQSLTLRAERRWVEVVTRPSIFLHDPKYLISLSNKFTAEESPILIYVGALLGLHSLPLEQQFRSRDAVPVAHCFLQENLQFVYHAVCALAFQMPQHYLFVEISHKTSNHGPSSYRHSSI